jgi:protein tyrosine phosphatase (PTP) superfamily phosphohydrolase (DUF442 family)
MRRWAWLAGAAVIAATVALVPPLHDAFEDGAGRALGELEARGLKMPNWHPYQSQVSPTLTRGSEVDAAGVADLQRRGFKAIVNLTVENHLDEPAARAAGLAFLRVPLIDNTAPSVEQMKAFLDFVTEPAHQPAYVHCDAGIGRTGVAVAVYRMAVQGWPVERALAEADQPVHILPCQRRFLRAFAAELSAGHIAGYPVQPERRSGAP